MKKVLPTLCFIISVVNVFAQSSKEKVIQATNTEKLKEMSDEFRKEAIIKKDEAIKKAKEKGWIIREVLKDGSIIELQALDQNGGPIYYETNNADAAKTTATNKVYSGGSLGLDLSGNNMDIGEWDGGAVRASHVEFGGRVNQVDGATSISSHATHVGGTMIGSGVNASAKGMAYQGNLLAHDWTNDNSEMSTAASNGLLVSNHSYGSISGWRYNSDNSEWEWWGDESLSTTEDYKFGYYDYWNAQAWDAIAHNAPYYLIVKSAGNDRNDSHTGTHKVRNSSNTWVSSNAVRPPDGGVDGYDCIASGGIAKNVLTIGAVNDINSGYSNPSEVSMSTFSGWGPTDDGRIKPDIVGNGVGVYSSESSGDNAYGSKSGTSMSAPNVSGSILMLQEHYENTSGSYMRSASLKALILHTAYPSNNNPGPNYICGWGLLNMEGAANFISENTENIIEEKLVNSGTYTKSFYSNGTEPIRVTICWTDPEANSLPIAVNDPTLRLINDLDIRIADANGALYKPYILDPANPANPATSGDNYRDNVEQIYINAPSSGIYTVSVTHKNSLSGGEQPFSMILEGSQILSSFNASANNSSKINLSWNLNANSGNVVLAYSLNETFGLPNNGSSYSVGDAILGGGTVAYVGNANSFNHTSLSANTTYYYKIWYYDGTEYSSAQIDNATTSPPQNPSSFFGSPFGNTAINLSWNLNANSDNVVLAYSLNETFGSPNNGSSYSIGDVILGGGTVLYNGNANSFNHSSLSTNTTFYYKIWSYNGNEYSSGLVDNATTRCGEANSLDATNITTNSAYLSWGSTGNEIQWEISWGFQGFYQGGLLEDGILFDNSLTSTNYTLITLQENTAYDYYVRSYCGNNSNSGPFYPGSTNEYSNWVGPFTFTTLSSTSGGPYTLIPDQNFEQALIDLGHDDLIDGRVLTANINEVTSLNVNNQNISNLEGIQDFSNLTSLSCKNNSLTSLDISQNTSLVNLNCRYNQISTLDVSLNSNLVSLICNDNNISTLDVSNNTLLQQLGCEDNELTSIDVSSNTALIYFICGDNQIASLDVSNNTALTYLGCHANILTELDVSNNSALTVLSFGDNQLTSIDVSNLNSLTEFRCYDNYLTCVNLKNGNNTNITSFNATGNPNLNCIEVDNPTWSTSNWNVSNNNIDSVVTFSISCSYPSGCFSGGSGGGAGSYPPGTVHCNGTPTAVVDVTNPITGKTWMDRNLGASRAATSSTDEEAYGDLYQWGRGADGHQCRNTTTTTTLSSTDQPGHGDFITSNSSANYDWRSPQKDNLWQGVNGTNNPCPSGYRLPAEAELDAERLSWSSNNSAGAFASPLKLPTAGRRSHSNGSLYNVGTDGSYWSSTVSGANSRFLDIYSSTDYKFRASGLPVRCLKD